MRGDFKSPKGHLGVLGNWLKGGKRGGKSILESDRRGLRGKKVSSEEKKRIRVFKSVRWHVPLKLSKGGIIKKKKVQPVYQKKETQGATCCGLGGTVTGYVLGGQYQ